MKEDRNNQSPNELTKVKNHFNKLFKYVEEKGDIQNIFDAQTIIDKMHGIFDQITCKKCKKFNIDYSQCSKCDSLICNICKLKVDKCPSCTNNFEQKRNDSVLRNVIGEILIKCQNCQNYGKKINEIKLKDYKNHLNNCEYSSYKCLTCNKNFSHSKKFCYEHSLQCGYSNISCSFCNKKIKKYIKDEHENKCKEELIECSFCKNQFKRCEINEHKSQKCEMREIECVNCKEVYIFKNGHDNKKCISNLVGYSKMLEEENTNLKSFIEINNLKARYDAEVSFKQIERVNSEVNLFKTITKKLDKSSIICDKDEKFLNSIFKEYKNIKFELIYNIAFDNASSTTFHSKCDKMGPTLSLFEAKTQSSEIQRFGLFTSESWDCSETYKEAEIFIIFCLTNGCKGNSEKYPIFCSKSCGPAFGKKSEQEPEFFIKGKNGKFTSKSSSEQYSKFIGGLIQFDIIKFEVYKAIYN